MEHCHCLILAAGKSSRIAPLAGDLPKPLLPIAGEPILFRNLRWLASYGLKNIWINLHYQASKVKDSLENTNLFNLNIHYLYEPKLLGTAGALKNAASHWSPQKTALVIYGDNLCNLDLNAFYEFHRIKKSVASIAVFDQTQNRHTGIAGGRVVLDANQKVLGFEEATDSSNSSFVNAGVYFIEAELLSMIPENRFSDFGHDIFPIFLEKQQAIYAYTMQGYCLGLDTPEAFKKGEYILMHEETTL